MSHDNDDDLEVFFFHGKKGEHIPFIVEKLIVKEGGQEVPCGLCRSRSELQKVVILSNDLIEIDMQAFAYCPKLLDIVIGSKVQVIRLEAFRSCSLLAKVEIEDSTSSPHQLRTTEEQAFAFCKSLQRIKLPSDLTTLGRSAFYKCEALVEADLSTTYVYEIQEEAF